MRMGYFGDSYDIVKQSLIGWLGEFGDWSVHPMLTRPATPEEVKAFERFLGAKVICAEVLARDVNRVAYLSCAGKCGNLFLDPDTGLRLRETDCRKPKAGYLFLEELVRLSKQRSHSLTLVFDQSLPAARNPMLCKSNWTIFKPPEFTALPICRMRASLRAAMTRN